MAKREDLLSTLSDLSPQPTNFANLFQSQQQYFGKGASGTNGNNLNQYGALGQVHQWANTTLTSIESLAIDINTNIYDVNSGKESKDDKKLDLKSFLEDVIEK